MNENETISIAEYFGQSCDWYDVPCHISSMLAWWFEFAVWVTFKIYEKFAYGIVSLINNLPVPSFVTDAITAVGGIPPTVVFFASALMIKEGIAMITAAYLTRWALKFVPFV